jgi:hypothetical protein
MGTISRPSKEQIRRWLAERRVERAPLPDASQIRHALKWNTSLDEVRESGQQKKVPTQLL